MPAAHNGFPRIKKVVPQGTQRFVTARHCLQSLWKVGLAGLRQREMVEAVLENRPLDLSLRTIQRRFLHATGLTRGTLDQIERARQAADLLEKGASITDAVFQAGYADQPHLTCSLKQFVGQTPGQILQISSSE